MTIWQKIIIGFIAGILWLAAIVGKHFWPDVDIAMFVVTCAAVIGSLGIHSIATGGVNQAGGQGGFASVHLLAALAIVALGLSLTGCAGTFGHTNYTVKANAVGGYDLAAGDGKEYAQGRTIAFSAASGQLMVQEGPSTAFKGQALGVKAINILPTMGLQDILAPRAQ